MAFRKCATQQHGISSRDDDGVNEDGVAAHTYAMLPGMNGWFKSSSEKTAPVAKAKVDQPKRKRPVHGPGALHGLGYGAYAAGREDVGSAEGGLRDL